MITPEKFAKIAEFAKTLGIDMTGMEGFDIKFEPITFILAGTSMMADYFRQQAHDLPKHLDYDVTITERK